MRTARGLSRPERGVVRIEKVIAKCCDAIIDNAEELTGLDRAIGDSDHGINMERGCKAVKERLPELSGLEPGEALVETGKTLVMKVGGASGPLFGTLAMSFGKALLAAEKNPEGIACAFMESVEAVQRRGKSHQGQKTMLDVLIPVAEAFRESPDDWRKLPVTADKAAESTVPMLAERGRASFLGERSVGHMDPGSRSCALLVSAACAALGDE